MLKPIKRLSWRSLLVVGGILALLGMPAANFMLQSQDSAAATTDLFFSEYVEGSSNNKAIEIYNGTGAAVNLSSYTIEIYSNGNSAPNATATLAGTLADSEVYVLANTSANATILAKADDTDGGVVNFNGNDAVILKKNGTVIDAIGQVGNDPGDEWGSGVTSTQNNTLRRKAAVCAGDATETDAFDPTTQWDGFAQDTFDGLGSHTANCSTADPPTVAGTTPADSATGVAISSNITINFSEDVTVTGNWFSIACDISGSVSAGSSGGPQTFTLDPATDFANAETCTVTISAAQVTDQDGSADNLAQDYVFSFTTIPVVANGCGETTTLISTIQGSGLTSPEDGNVHTIEGIVVGDFQEGDNGATAELPDYDSDLDGFYIQEESADQDNDPATSEGIFVFTGDASTTVPDVGAGEIVRVTGEVTEFNDLTELTSVSAITSCGSGTLPTPEDIQLPVDPRSDLERYEGMLVRFPQTLVIAEYFNFDRFGEIVLALPLDNPENLERPFRPTSYIDPGPEVNPVAEAIELRRITLDDARTSQNPDPARHPNGAEFTLGNHFRGGDTVQNAVGVLDYRFDKYRIQPTDGADYTATNPRPAAPEDIGGSLTVAGFNVLNYFTTLGERGADDAAEFTRQRDKIIAALAAIDADVVGLIEIENNMAALQDLVSGLNNAVGADTYAAIETGAIGTDAIKVALIYKPGSVTPTGDFAVLDDPSFTNPNNLDTPKNRPALAQTFTEEATGERFTVVVNHLKSKGSDCGGPPDDDPQQGNCNGTRTAATRVLLDWLATDPTGSTDPDTLILGDLNAYDEEDPIDAMKAGADDTAGTTDDYTDLVEQSQGEFAYSFVFDGQFGYLDYALATQALLPQVTGTTEWHINADEPDILDYDTSFKQAAQAALYEPNPYRSSDHDPVIVGLNLGAADAGMLYLPLAAR